MKKGLKFSIVLCLFCLSTNRNLKHYKSTYEKKNIFFVWKWKKNHFVKKNFVKQTTISKIQFKIRQMFTFVEVADVKRVKQKAQNNVVTNSENYQMLSSSIYRTQYSLSVFSCYSLLLTTVLFFRSARWTFPFVFFTFRIFLVHTCDFSTSWIFHFCYDYIIVVFSFG